MQIIDVNVEMPTSERSSYLAVITAKNYNQEKGEYLTLSQEFPNQANQFGEAQSWLSRTRDLLSSATFTVAHHSHAEHHE